MENVNCANIPPGVMKILYPGRSKFRENILNIYIR
jgi:hypothetical protein